MKKLKSAVKQALFIIFFPALVWGQDASTRSLKGNFSFGLTDFSVSSPTGVSLNRGRYFSIAAEKGIGKYNLYIAASLNYLGTTGKADYFYVSPTTTYSASQVDFTLSTFQAALGLRFRFIERYWISPYIEGGVLGGYFQIAYDETLRIPSVTSRGGDYKTIDGVLDFGFYGEIGLDFVLSSNFGLRISDHYGQSTTRPIETLNKRELNYTANSIVGTLVFRL